MFRSLNLVGEAAVDYCIEGISFSGFVQGLYNFFSASTKLWSVLEQFASNSLKSLSNTRWSAHADSVKTIHQNYNKLKFWNIKQELRLEIYFQKWKLLNLLYNSNMGSNFATNECCFQIIAKCNYYSRFMSWTLFISWRLSS